VTQTQNAIVRYAPAADDPPAATPEAPRPRRMFGALLEPWRVDETICSDQPLPPHEAIEARAREIWEMRGRPTNADLEIWLEAQGQFVAALR
jgi:hypothetical protein